MIFVATGSLRPFLRLLEEVDYLIDQYHITEKVIVQAGYTQYTARNFTSFEFVSDKDFKKYIEEASIIITHAGSGALFNAIKSEKKTIAFARLKKYNEAIDDHQLELATKLTTERYILDGTYSLCNAWEKLENFTPRKFDFTSTIISHLKEYLDSFSH